MTFAALVSCSLAPAVKALATSLCVGITIVHLFVEDSLSLQKLILDGALVGSCAAGP